MKTSAALTLLAATLVVSVTQLAGTAFDCVTRIKIEDAKLREQHAEFGARLGLMVQTQGGSEEPRITH